MSKRKEIVSKRVEELALAGDIEGAIAFTFDTPKHRLQKGVYGYDELALASVEGVGKQGFYNILEEFGTADHFVNNADKWVGWWSWTIAKERRDRIVGTLARYLLLLRKGGYGPTDSEGSERDPTP